MLKVVNIIALSLFILTLYIPVSKIHAEAPSISGLIFSEVKVRYDSASTTDFDEFIEIYNNSTSPVLLSDFALEYFNVTNPTSAQLPTQKPIDNNYLGAYDYFVLAKQPLQIPHSKQSPLSSLSDTGGRLRLVTTESAIVDEIAWTNSQSTATLEGMYPPVLYQCNASTALCSSNKTQSITRKIAIDGTYLQSSIWQLVLPTPISSELQALVIEPPDEEDPIVDPDEEEPELPQTPPVTCEGVTINEIAPNPSGSDANKEFVELYNPTDEVIALTGCSLQASGSNKTYVFGEVTLQPGEYKAFYDSTTGLTLPNSAGGTVWLLSPQEELDKVEYPGDMPDDTSWSALNDVWQLTYLLTPSAPNVSLPVKPCLATQERNIVTNKCENIVSTATITLTPCKVGQERNPETNRCRSTTVLSSVLVPCKEGQERNPETNRCRNVSDDEVQPCAEGQERNPETNRCRKVSASAGTTLAAVTDVPSKTVQKNSRWLLAVAALLLALGYAVYEWRQDIMVFLTKRISRIKS